MLEDTCSGSQMVEKKTITRVKSANNKYNLYSSSILPTMKKKPKLLNAVANFPILPSFSSPSTKKKPHTLLLYTRTEKNSLINKKLLQNVSNNKLTERRFNQKMSNVDDILNNDEALNKEARKIFKSYDIDGSGYIEKNEMRKPLLDFMALTGVKKSEVSEEDLNKTIDDAIKDLDTNKDGKLSFDEFKEFIVGLISLGIINNTTLM